MIEFVLKKFVYYLTRFSLNLILLKKKVLLVGSSDFTIIGRPILSPHFARVEGIVIEKTLSQTQMEYYYAPKKKKVGARHQRKYSLFSLIFSIIIFFY